MSAKKDQNLKGSFVNPAATQDDDFLAPLRQPSQWDGFDLNSIQPRRPREQSTNNPDHKKPRHNEREAGGYDDLAEGGGGPVPFTVWEGLAGNNTRPPFIIWLKREGLASTVEEMLGHMHSALRYLADKEGCATTSSTPCARRDASLLVAPDLRAALRIQKATTAFLLLRSVRHHTYCEASRRYGLDPTTAQPGGCFRAAAQGMWGGDPCPHGCTGIRGKKFQLCEQCPVLTGEDLEWALTMTDEATKQINNV
jgi:hypothetical protein